MTKRILLLLVALCLTLTSAQSNHSQDIYYEIFVRSFQDSDGDGIGDLRGATERLEYLQDLGISGIWLMPIHPSPSYHGYDVTDFLSIHPDYGTMEDFQTFLYEAQARGMKVVLDLVVNHTSNEHPWFQAAAAGDPDYRDYYLWAERDLGWRGTSGNAAWHALGDSYYLGLFWGGMPDLNYRNPVVMEEMQEIARYWLEMGVDGFRIDAIQHIVESPEGGIRNTPETFAWVRDFTAFIHSVNPDSFLLGETWTDTELIARYHEVGNLDMSFNYPLYLELIGGIIRRTPSTLAFTMRTDERLYPEDALRATFISNHDQIRPGTTLSPIGRDTARMKLASSLLLTMPGIPFLYYGEEIGMPNGVGERDEEKRTPMRWDTGENAGFTDGTPWHPFSTTDPAITVEAQAADPDSILNHYRTLIALRREHAALSSGSTTVLEPPHPPVLAFVRELEGERLLVLANFSNRALEISLASLADVETSTDLLTGIEHGEGLTLEPLAVMVLDVTQ